MRRALPSGVEVPLAGFYATLFGAVGIIAPYLSPWLASGGFSPTEIGTLLAASTIAKIVAANLWGLAADRAERRAPVLRASAAAGALAFVVVAVADGFWSMLLGLVVFALAWNGTSHQADALTLAHLEGRGERYGPIRLWGSIGFVVTAAGGGWALERLGAGATPLLVMALLAVVVLAGLRIPEPAPRPPASDTTPGLGAALRRPEVVGLLVASALMQASHGPFYVFFSIYLGELGHRPVMVGALWAVGVIAEIVLFACLPRLLARVGLRTMLLASLWLAAGRWLITGLAGEWLVALVLAQVLHAATFGAYHAAAVQRVQALFGPSRAARGQALYSSLGFGVGGAVGAWGAGASWSSAGGATAAWLGAAVAAALGAVVLARAMPAPTR
ncbi:MAG: MFS transporter [Ectothiorhodospiraceae bacterium]|nr:MFS transporter [Chromatiales bacterium]MCP5153947.1 MFS transporter [Ectothiorhodospiraceae bacterium]